MAARKRFQYGIASLLALTALVAVVIRLTDNSGVVELTFHDLQFDSKLRGASGLPVIPASVKRLNGRKVRIRGYIYPASIFQEKGIQRFVLARDINEPPAAMNDTDFAIVRLGGESGIDFTVRPIEVSGTLTVSALPAGSGKRPLFYEIMATNVEPLY